MGHRALILHRALGMWEDEPANNNNNITGLHTQPLSSFVQCMMTSSNGKIIHVTGPLCGEFTGHRWIPLTKANHAELWCLLSSASEQTVEQTIETLVVWDAIALIMMSL